MPETIEVLTEKFRVRIAFSGSLKVDNQGCSTNLSRCTFGR